MGTRKDVIRIRCLYCVLWYY